MSDVQRALRSDLDELPSFADAADIGAGDLDAATVDLSGPALEALLVQERLAPLLPAAVVALADEVARLDAELAEERRQAGELADALRNDVRAWRETAESLEESLQRVTRELQEERAARIEAERERPASLVSSGGAADGGSEASQAAQGSLSSAAIGAGADSGAEQPAPASAPAQHGDAAPGRAEGHLDELLRVAALPRECPLLHTLEVGSGALAVSGPDVRVSFSSERGSVDIDGTYVELRPAPQGAE